MKIREIYALLNELSPFENAASWDNGGLLLGSFDDEIKAVYLSLDVDSNLLDEVCENALIIAHHPLIFSGIKKLNYAKYPSNLIQKMVQKNISLIAMHTSFDISHLNAFVASKLGFTTYSGGDFILYMDVNRSFDEFALLVKNTFNLTHLRCVKTKDWIKKCAITTGSGGDLISQIEADCFLSGDFKYHQALEAKENNLSLMDIGHFESERYFPECLGKYLKNLPVKVIMSNSKNPFEYK